MKYNKKWYTLLMNNQTAQDNLHPLIASSVDATKISATVTGFLTTIASGVFLVANLKHINLTPDAYNTFTQQVGSIIFAIITAVGAAYTLFGLLRKAVMRIFPKKGTVTPLVVTPINTTTIIE